MQLFYTPSLTPETRQFEFDKDESRHIVRVLRNKEGDTLSTTNGKGYIFGCRIIDAHPQHCRAEVTEVQRKYPKRYHLHLAVALTKNSSRYEWFLEKATEIGVHEITPLICSRSERKSAKAGRLEKVVESAMKQSLRAFLPTLHPPKPLKEFLEEDRQGMLFIAHCQEEEKTDLKRRMGADQDVVILIGPEGDFTLDEIKLAYERGYSPVSLGEARLRTETAAIMACATVAVINSG